MGMTEKPYDRKDALDENLVKKGMELLRAKELANRADVVSAMKNETDPEEIMRQVLVKHANMSFDIEKQQITDNQVKWAAIENPNTPILLLIQIYHSPIDSANYRGVPPRALTPLAEEQSIGVHKAAFKEIAKRNWVVGDWERNNLSPERLFVLEHILLEDKLNYEQEKIKKGQTQKPSDDVFKKLITHT
jgi:hypothetical protein